VARGSWSPRQGRGTFVAPARPSRGRHLDTGWQTVALGEATFDGRDVAALLHPAGPEVLLLSAGYPSAELQPLAALTAAAARAARRPGAWALAPTAGLPELRALLAATVGADPGDVLVVPGRDRPGLSAALRALAPPGSPVLVEVPTYLGALAAARAAGLRRCRCRRTPGDCGRTCCPRRSPAAAPAALRQPTYANPTGVVLDPARRAAVLDAARQRAPS
jgi:DNA-binding transcriptional MocR family regulator